LDVGFEWDTFEESWTFDFGYGIIVDGTIFFGRNRGLIIVWFL
jgi:hypothetical protein